MWWLGGLVNTHIGTMCVCACVWWFVYFLYLDGGFVCGGLVAWSIHTSVLCVCVCTCVWWFVYFLYLDGGFVCGGLVGKGKERGGLLWLILFLSFIAS